MAITAAMTAKARQVTGLIAWLVLCYLAAGIGAFASIDAASFYDRLVQPAWAPPAPVFGPVWTGLYTLMAVAAWMVWRERGFRAGRVPLVLFLLQLAVNALWSWLFFAWHQGALALFDIAVLCLLVSATLLAFWRVHRLAGALLIPYLLWILFAAALNTSVWQLNPQLLG